MKKILIFIMLSLPLFAMAQTDSLKTKAKEQYCMVTEVPKALSRYVTISVDFGQQQGFWVDRIKDEQGKVKSFNSIVDGLNYMASQGWELVNSYSVKEGDSSYSAHYIMKRKLQ